jgi:hypothetical protein
MDDFLIALRPRLATCTMDGLNNVIGALPALSSGVRLSEVVADAQVGRQGSEIGTEWQSTCTAHAWEVKRLCVCCS